MDTILLNVEQDLKFKINNPLFDNSKQTENLNLQYYNTLLKHYSTRLNRNERNTRAYLKDEIRRLKFKTSNNFADKIRYGRLARWINRFLSLRNNGIKFNRTIVNGFQNKIGQRENFLLLDKAIKDAGFNQDISKSLEKLIAQGLPKFHIRYTDVRCPETEFILHFNIIPGTGAYQFANFEAAGRLQIEHNYGLQEHLWHSFSLNADVQISATEASRLVNGKSICKENDTWITLGNNNAYSTDRFNLEAELKKLPIQKMSAIEYKKLTNALKFGASKEVTLILDGIPVKYNLEASPSHQCIRILDKNKQLVDLPALKERTSKQSKLLANIEKQSEAKVIKMRR
ncbi:hypothetical protein [Chitinophaga niabensis]|nr:hypothetical protein [Chitinophaga niabensis]